MKRILILLLLTSLYSCQKKKETVKAEKASITESVYASGIIKSKNQYQVFATVNGVVQDVFVKEGDTVKTGDLLLTISNETQRLNRENAALAAQFSDFEANKGKLEEARLQMELAESKYRNDSLLFSRQQQLFAQNVGSKIELEQRELAFQNSRNSYVASRIRFNDLKRQLEFNANQSKKNLMIASKQESDFMLRSEMYGIVYALYKSKGEMVSMQNPLAIIGDAKEFLIEMQIDEYDILKVKEGQKVVVTMDSYKGQVFEAKVSRIVPIMNERSKTFLVEALFTQGPPRLYPNITLEANIVIQQKDKVLLVPRNYLQGDTLVFLKSGQAAKVKTGLKDYRFMEIISGINEGDELIKPE
jgi:HlyD family secretion protein